MLKWIQMASIFVVMQSANCCSHWTNRRGMSTLMISVSYSLSDCCWLTLSHWIIFAMMHDNIQLRIYGKTYEHTDRQTDTAHIPYVSVGSLMLTPTIKHIHTIPHLLHIMQALPCPQCINWIPRPTLCMCAHWVCIWQWMYYSGRWIAINVNQCQPAQSILKCLISFQHTKIASITSPLLFIVTLHKPIFQSHLTPTCDMKCPCHQITVHFGL